MFKPSSHVIVYWMHLYYRRAAFRDITWWWSSGSIKGL